MKEIKIINDDNQVRVVATDIDFETFTNMLCTAQLIFMNRIKAAHPELVPTLYDKYNESASNLLCAFAPEIERHPDLTMEAILKAELDIVKSRQ